MCRPAPSQMNRADFVACFGDLYEHSPWVAELAFELGIRPRHDNADALHGLLRQVVDDADEIRLLELLRAHPDLAGKAALAGTLTAASSEEQSSAALDQCSAAELAEFQQLNQAYKDKFGFPFILAVKGRSRQDILQAFRARLNNARETEFTTALEQVHRIARLRLEAILYD